jgi:cinnamoyl-CoA:phenyllactate CoA-transferase
MSVDFLKGVKVLELATFIAAPTAARILADFGAEVIKVESFSGDPLRYTGPDKHMPLDPNEALDYDYENANKMGISLNLKSPKGIEIFNQLLDESDIFVTNLRTQALEKLGLDYETISNKKPEIVFAQVLGYGAKGPLKDKPGFDFTAYTARGGWSGTLYEKGSSPVNAAPGMGDHSAGMCLLSGILAAYIKAKNTGIGEMVTVSLYHAAVYGMGIMIQSAQYGNSYPISRTSKPNPLLTTYLTSDERWIQLAIPEYNKYIAKFLEVIEKPELMNDERFNTLSGVSKNAETFNGIIYDSIKSKPLEVWVKAFEDADLCFEICQTWEEILEDEQAWENDMLYKMDYPTGQKAMVRTPIMFKNAGLPRYDKGPKLGEHTKEILSSIGYDQKGIEQLRNNKDII